jgi:hypothetical protein
MKRISVRLFVAAACIGASTPFAAPALDDTASPLLGVKIPPGYRDWPVISVAHEAGNNNDLRAVLGNAMAIKAFREGKLQRRQASVPGRHNHCPAGLELRSVRGKQQGLWPCPVLRCRLANQPSIVGQGLKKIRLDGRVGFRSI